MAHIISNKDYTLLQEVKKEQRSTEKRERERKKQKECNHENSRNIVYSQVSASLDAYKCFDCGLTSGYSLDKTDSFFSN